MRTTFGKHTEEALTSEKQEAEDEEEADPKEEEEGEAERQWEKKRKETAIKKTVDEMLRRAKVISAYVAVMGGMQRVDRRRVPDDTKIAQVHGDFLRQSFETWLNDGKLPGPHTNARLCLMQHLVFAELQFSFQQMLRNPGALPNALLKRKDRSLNIFGEQHGNYEDWGNEFLELVFFGCGMENLVVRRGLTKRLLGAPADLYGQAFSGAEKLAKGMTNWRGNVLELLFSHAMREAKKEQETKKPVVSK